MSVRKDGKIIAGTTVNPCLFDCKWADHILNNASWLRADTFSWQPGDVYGAAYNHLADDISGKSLSSETISGITVQFYLAGDGHKICPASEESNVVGIYNATGVAWYYILDTANQRFKLPRTKFGFTGLRDTVGKYVAPGLPDHTHKVQYRRNDNSGYHANGSVSPHIYVDSNLKGSVDTLAASQSNSIYGASTTVQPPVTQMYLYFYVGNFTPTALENTAGLNAELFNSKVDVGHEVVEYQEPTSANNYTWYRKYADGWAEQGITYINNTSTNTFSLPVAMADTNYSVTLNAFANMGNHILYVTSRTTTQISLYHGDNKECPFSFEVRGIAAS